MAQTASPYTLLNNWIYDGKADSKVPNEVLTGYLPDAKYLLFFFRGSKYLVYLNKIFNNFNIYQLDKEEVFIMLKDIVRRTKFRPGFYKIASKTKIKLIEVLRKKFPTLKISEINLLANKIDTADNKDEILETLGLKKSVSSKRTTKKDLEQISVNQELIEDDGVMEVDAAEALKEMGEQDVEEAIPLSVLMKNFTIEGS